MKVLVFSLTMLFWLAVIIFIKTQIEFSYRYEKLTSQIFISFKVLFFKYKIIISLPRENTIKGLDKIIDNVLTDLMNKEQVQKTNSSRYRQAKKGSSFLLNNILNSWLKVVWLKQRLAEIQREFLKKIKLYEFNLNLHVGCDDAANTGMLIGSLWLIIGHLTARLYRTVTIVKDQINIEIQPDFNQQVLLCSSNCILNLQISHIIFTAYKILGIFLKSRRIS